MEEILRQAPLFVALDDEAASALRATMVEIKISRGDELFVEGDPGEHLYVIVEGNIKLGTASSDGRESILA